MGPRIVTGCSLTASGQGHEFCGDLAGQVPDDQVVGGHERFRVLALDGPLKGGSSEEQGLASLGTHHDPRGLPLW